MLKSPQIITLFPCTKVFCNTSLKRSKKLPVDRLGDRYITTTVIKVLFGCFSVILIPSYASQLMGVDRNNLYVDLNNTPTPPPLILSRIT